jgi:hypothetical protein
MGYYVITQGYAIVIVMWISKSIKIGTSVFFGVTKQ